VREAVWKNITETLAPSVRIAVVTMSGRGHQLDMVDFTDDRDKIHSALYHVVPNPVFRSQCFLCGDLSFVHGYKIAMGDRQALKRGIPIVTGAAVTDLELSQQRIKDDLVRIVMRTETKAQLAVAAGERETELSLYTLRTLSKRMASLAGSRTIVLIGHWFFVTHQSRSDLENMIDQAIRAGVVIDTLNSSGLMTGGEIGSGYDDDRMDPASGTGMGAGSPYAHDASLYGSMTLGAIADGTGGTAIENTNDYLGAVRRVAAPPEYRYVLGISPQNLAPTGSFTG
jgi:VWFA-related protein